MKEFNKTRPRVPWAPTLGTAQIFSAAYWSKRQTSDHDSVKYKSIRGKKMNLHLLPTLLTAGLLHVYGLLNAQQISINTQNTSIRQVFQQLEKQSGYSFFYKDIDMEKIRTNQIVLKNTSLKEALKAILEPNGLDYEIVNKTIVIKSIPKASRNNKAKNSNNQNAITGTIIDETGTPIVGATLRLKNEPRKAVQSMANGNFSLPLSADGQKVIVSMLGFENSEFTAKKSTEHLTLKLKRVEHVVDEVIVTGMMERKKESFTGATSSFTGEELKMVNNQNIVASLRALDPSFIQIENNSVGSNPNALPTIELRGQTSIATSSLRDEFSSDPNQPLFILDGFESDLRTIMSLDMNIIKSATILKDAASTAIYGSRASNGVVVIETIKPVAGKVRLSYTSDLNLEFPDLSSYNMMNAAEKLEFERLSGRYTATSNTFEQQIVLDKIYNDRLQNVLRGVDTYWLDKPIQTAYSQRHSLSARGGEGAVVFDLGGNYRTTKGALIGSGREDWGANINLNYRTGKLNIANRAFASGYTGNESPYGSFSSWVNTNPYYELKSIDEKYLARTESINSGYFISIANPLYNASLSSYNRTKNYTISNNLQLTYTFNPAFRITAGAQISKSTTNSNAFVSPLDTEFDEVTNDLKGRLTYRGAESFSYTANVMLTYAKVFQKVHSLTANLRGEINENNSRSNGYIAVGFPSASNGNPSFAFGYQTGSKPSVATRIARRNSIVASVNYSYDQRYNADFNYNLDGSTSFGSNNLYSPYYSIGFSWNAHKEQFLQNTPWINSLRLRGNIGITGNQSFGNVSQSIFDYDRNVNRFGQGIYLSALGAPDLEWQRTRQTSIGLDGTFFKNKLNVQVNAFDKYTDPLVVAVTLPASTGLSNYPFNAGTLDVKGIETIINYSPIYRPKDQFVLTFGLTGAITKQRYDNFNDKLNSLNEEMQTSQSLVRFKDGYSPRDLWAVRSLGIDPATGQEVFLSKDGQQTFNYNTNDIVVVGSSQPLAEGTLRGTLGYKGFTASVIIRYKLKSDYLNSALYNKVENISINNVENNQDKRALYERWKNPGDIAQFKAIAITGTTPISSRFVQDENTFSGESINFGYEFRGKRWLDRAKLSNLRLSAYMNDIFYTSTVKRERGIDYPFTRSISLSLNATLK
ncbi:MULTISPECIES: SusC/RagA family TonB-linked outer membrane protein [Sphingobacterium]|uniref:SusC/RagA family TonB-linked outer membrane protein n=1 Tax=Sphingobacterium TaxID=28453 RepID=UPI00257E1D76|nr:MULTISPECIES: SusC/RagA family TonB-linked outer membrane protein [Sphingobacterium]